MRHFLRDGCGSIPTGVNAPLVSLQPGELHPPLHDVTDRLSGKRFNRFGFADPPEEGAGLYAGSGERA